jgi:hypothetical protein
MVEMFAGQNQLRITKSKTHSKAVPNPVDGGFGLTDPKAGGGAELPNLERSC